MDKCSKCYIVDRAKLAYCPDCKKAKKTSQDAPTVDVLDKIRTEIDRQEKWLLQAGYTAYNVDIAFDSIKSVLAESEIRNDVQNNKIK